jgi:hypothetical protein
MLAITDHNDLFIKSSYNADDSNSATKADPVAGIATSAS